MRAGSGVFITPLSSANVLEFTLVGEGVASLHLRVGEWVLTLVCAYAPNSSPEYPPFSESLEKVHESALNGESIVFLGLFNSHVGNKNEN